MGLTSTLGVGIVLSFFLSGTSALTGANRAMSQLVHTSGALSGQLTQTGKAVVGFLGGIVALKAGMAGLDFVMGSITSYATYERELLDLQGLLGNTSEEMAGFEAHALSMARTYAYTAGEVAQGMWRIASAGFTQAEVLKMTESVLQYATIGHMDLADAAYNLSNVMRAFSIPAEDAQYTLDRITQTMSMYQLTMADFQTGFATWGMVAANTNQSLEEMLAIWGSFTSMGLSVSRSGMMLKMMLTNLFGASPQSRAIRDALGIDIIDQTTGEVRSLIDIMDDLQKAFENPVNIPYLENLIGKPEEWTAATEAELFALTRIYGRRAIAGFLGITGLKVEREGAGMLENFEAIRYDSAEIADSFGYAQEYTDTMMSGWEYIQTNIKTSVDTINLLIGKPFVEAIKPIMQEVLSGVNVVSTFLEQHPQIAAAMGATVAIGSLFAVIGGLFMILTSLSTILKGSAIKMTLGALLKIGAGFALKFLLVAAIIAGIIYLVVRFKDDIAGFLVGIGEWIWVFIGNPIKDILGIIKWLIMTLRPFFIAVGALVAGLILAFTTGVVFIGGILAAIFVTALTIFSLVWNLIAFIIGAISIEEFRSRVDSIFAFFVESLEAITGVVVGWIKDVFWEAVEWIKDFLLGWTKLGVSYTSPAAQETFYGQADVARGFSPFAMPELPETLASGSYGLNRDGWFYGHEGEQVVQEGASSYNEDSAGATFSGNNIEIHIHSSGDAEVDVDNIVAAIENRFNSNYERVMA